MRNYLLFIAFLPLFLQAQTNSGSGEKDVYKLTLTAAGVSEACNLYIDNSRAAKYEIAQDDVRTNLENSPFKFVTLAVNGSGFEGLLKDKRPYEEGAYFVNFPLSVTLEPSKTYTFTVNLLNPSTRPKNDAALIFRIIDKSHPDKFIDLLELQNGYSFTSDNATAKQKFDDRFIARVYAASLFKDGTLFDDAPVDNDWNNPANWWGGVPGTTGSATEKQNNCAVIPANTDVIIPAKASVSIGTLLNSGNITIEEKAVLNIENEAKLASITELYYK